jgi:hypothetical protein
MMRPHQQRELDFGTARQIRIGRALRASPAVARAVPLSDADKFMLTCMNALALQIAEEAARLPGGDAQRHIAGCVSSFIATLDDVSAEFARETSRYLTDTVAGLLEGK